MKNHLYRKAWSLLIALSCVLSVMPVNIQAEENETVILDEITETVSTDNGQENNDELFAEYVDRLFTAKETVQPGRKKAAAKPSVALDEPALTVYNSLYELAVSTASGNRDNTIITFDDSQLGLGEQKTWSASDLGVESVYKDGTVPEDARTMLDSKLQEMINPNKILSLLMAEYPYEFYWYDKTIGTSYGYSFGIVSGAEGNSLYITGYQMKLAVAEEYRDQTVEQDSEGNYLCAVNTQVTGAAVAAASNAADIVTQNSTLSDLEKLTAYKDEICNLVSYNTAAAQDDSTPYGNPWQLIWVFDKDDTTNVVCEGYSKAFQYLCNMSQFNNSNIECISVTGTMSGGTGAGPHMWNIVTMENCKHYLTDVTNCDSGTIGEGDGLFMKGVEALDSGWYQAVIEAGTSSERTIKYNYDNDTHSLWDTSGVLNLADADYQFDPPY